MTRILSPASVGGFIACELLLLLSLALAYLIEPYAVFLPDIYLGGGSDAMQWHRLIGIALVFIASYTIGFLLIAVVNSRLEPLDRQRDWNHVSITTIANTAAVVYLFLFTDRTFIVRLYGLTFLIYPLLYLVARVAIDAGRGTDPANAIRSRLASLPGTFKTVWTLGALVSLALFGGLFAAFYVDKDMRNTINVLRASSSVTDSTNWFLEPVCPDLTFDRPIDLEFQSGTGSRYLVLERPGRVRSVDGACQSETLLDITHQISSTEIENGALAIGIHPGFRDDAAKTNALVFVYYTAKNDDQNVVRLSKFDLSGPFDGRAATETVLIEQTRDDTGFHNGGSLLFDRQGFLYWSVGELTDTDAHQRIDKSFAGGIFRIDVDERGGEISSPIRNRVDGATTQGYYVPNDNPFVGTPDALEEYWVLGLRNPFRVWLDEDSQEIWVGDVGTDTYEEITIVERGHNGQYPIFEGPLQQRDELDDYIGTPKPPAHYYRQTSVLRAVIGGGVYRGGVHGTLDGSYVFADNQAGFVYQWDFENDTDPVILAQSRFAGQNGITSLAFPSDGEIFVTALGSSKEPSGLVARLQPLAEGEVAPAGSASPAVAVSNYDQNCVRCHGPNGRGAGARALVEGAPDFSDPEWQESVTDEHIATVIVEGGAAAGLSELMPAWGDAFDDAELERMVERIRSFDDASD